jgi:hypothetical protein
LVFGWIVSVAFIRVLSARELRNRQKAAKRAKDERREFLQQELHRRISVEIGGEYIPPTREKKDLPPPLELEKIKLVFRDQRDLDDERWSKFESSGTTIYASDVPWPQGPEDNVLSIDPDVNAEERKLLLRKAYLRWHPDKFVNRFGPRFAENEEEEIKAKLLEVIQAINELKAED